MELRQLRYFLAVAEELNFGRAASRLHMAQPPLSRQIRALETELAVRLFQRTSRGVSLTDAGRVFREEARAALAQAERAAEHARRAVEGEVGRLAIAFAPALEPALLPRLLPPFLARHPGVRLEVHGADAEEQVAALRAGTAQLGVAPMPIGAPNDLAVEALVSEELCVIVPERHRLARRPAITLAQLATEPIVFFRRAVAPHLHDLIASMLRQAGLFERVRCHTSHLHTCLALVAAGVGVTMLPAGTRGIGSTGVAHRPLRPAVKLGVGLIYRRMEPSALVRDFIRTAHAAVGNPRRSTLTCDGRLAAKRAVAR